MKVKMVINITSNFPQIEKHYIKSYLYANENFKFYCCVAHRCLQHAKDFDKTFDLPITHERIANLLYATLIPDDVYKNHLAEHTKVENQEQLIQSKEAFAHLVVQEVANKYQSFEKFECPINFTNKCSKYITNKPIAPKILK